jgi:hypothetical protein
MVTLAPGAVWRPVRNHTEHQIVDLGLVVHSQQGNNSPWPWFDNPASQASSTWWIAKGGRLEQFVDVGTEYAWAQGSGNRGYCSVEFEGYVGEALTEAQLDTAAGLYAWGARTRGWRFQLAERPGQKGLGWHGMGASAGWGHPDCPGPIRRGQRTEILDRASALLAPKTPDLKTTEDLDMTPDQEKKLDTLLERTAVIIRQQGGDVATGKWPGWPQLGNHTVVDALEELLHLVGAIPEETRDALMQHMVVVRDPKVGTPDRIQLETALTRASEAAEARQLLDGTVKRTTSPAPPVPPSA